MRKIVIALPKNERLIRQSYEIFKSAGYGSHGLEQELTTNKSHKQLEFPCNNGEAIILLAQIVDIPQYVDKNWADVGISNFDSYREYELSSATFQGSMRGDNFIADILPDLGLCSSACFCVAGKPEMEAFYKRCQKSDEKILTAATQHPNIAAKFFANKNIIADIITITGSSELMPKYGEVDVIFDLVETGQALKENGLIVFEKAMPIQSKILVSKAALKYDVNIAKMVEVLKNALKP